jgi:hypothetical protein
MTLRISDLKRLPSGRPNRTRNILLDMKLSADDQANFPKFTYYLRHVSLCKLVIRYYVESSKIWLIELVPGPKRPDVGHESISNNHRFG